MARRRAPTRKYEETDLLDRLAIRYAAPAYAFLPQVRDSTGAVAARTADAIAMSVWPSRGLVLHGFEIKIARPDWVKELKDPAKAEMIAQFCDFWHLVVGDAEIVKAGELPEMWGLIAPYGKGLRVHAEAKKLEAEPIDRDFLAAILRRAAEDCPYRTAVNEDYKRGLADGKSQAAWTTKHSESELAALQSSVDDFEKASGIKLDRWGYRSAKIGEAARFLVDNPDFAATADKVAATVEDQARNARRIADALASMRRQRKQRA